ncbi:MAG: antirestriction protein ArdA [Crinalium sp.]
MKLLFVSESDAAKFKSQVRVGIVGTAVREGCEVTIESIDLDDIRTAIKELGIERPTPVINADEGEPSVYVICLAAEDEGLEYGAWINANQGEYEISDDIDSLLACSPAEEDLKGWEVENSRNFEDIEVSGDDADDIGELGRAIAEHGEAFVLFYKNNPVKEPYRKVVSQFNREFKKYYTSENAFVSEMLNEDGTLEKLSEVGLNINCLDLETVLTEKYKYNDGFSFLSGEKNGIYVFES